MTAHFKSYTYLNRFFSTVLPPLALSTIFNFKAPKGVVRRGGPVTRYQGEWRIFSVLWPCCTQLETITRYNVKLGENQFDILLPSLAYPLPLSSPPISCLLAGNRDPG
jgi:hypothetical protein